MSQNTNIARNNRGTPGGAFDLNAAKKMAADYHWYPEGEFEKHVQIMDFDDDNDLDDNGQRICPVGQTYIRYGSFARVHFRAPPVSGRHPKAERDTVIILSPSQAKASHLVFDPNLGVNSLLYIKTPKAVNDVLAERFWKQNKMKARKLSEWARIAGGKHANSTYADISAKPIGVATAVVYNSGKKDDVSPGSPSCFYIHRLGEVSKELPILVCDAAGRLHLCGSSYTCETAGITN